MTTQYAQASYQEIIDLHTESDSVSVVGVHTPCSDTPYHMLRGFWDQFKKFKYNGCSISLVPVAQLPVDPLQVSYDAGEPTIDPRDMVNPILFHGCHGNDMGAILNGLYSEPNTSTGTITTVDSSDSVDHTLFYQTSGGFDITNIFESLYYRALTDNTWLKAHPQRGFRKNGLHPMIYSMASTFQISPTGSADSFDVIPYGVTHDDSTGAATRGRHGSFGNGASGDTVYVGDQFGTPQFGQTGGAYFMTDPAVKNATGFLTPRLQRLGWMDTRNVVGAKNDVSQLVSTVSEQGLNDALAGMYLKASNTLKPVLTPKIFMGMIMLPPAYKVQQHFRLVLNHSFSFAKFRGASMQYPNTGFIKDAYSVFNFSVEDESKKIDPVDPDEKGDDDDESKDVQ